MRSFMIVLVLLTALMLSACNENDSTAPKTKYTLTIYNNTPGPYDVYHAQSGGQFSQDGAIAGNGVFVISSLSFNVEYTVRLVEPGGEVESPTYEETIISEGDNLTWSIP